MGTKIVRICLTAILAFIIAKLVSGLLFFVIWPTLYWGWGYLGRRRAAHGLRTPLWNTEMKSPAEPVAKKRSELQRVVRALAFTIAAITVAGVVLVIISIESDKRKAKEARARVQEGMTVGAVLHSVGAGVFPWANSDAPRTDSDHPRALNLSPSSGSGKYFYFDSALSQDREISEPEALALLHQRLGDGYRWRVEYYFAGTSLEHFSFKMVFDKDGRVREVTPLFGSFE